MFPPHRSYQYNSENHIVRIDSETGEHLYTYDELYRLIEARFAEEMGLQNEAYTYDGVANRLTEGGGEPWEYNENHQLISKPGATFEYDANGHTVRKVEQDGTVTLYEYDLAERLRQVRIEGGAILGSYRYDPFGRRVSKTTLEGTIYFHYDESGLLAEYDAAGNLLAEYQYWPGSTWMTNPLFKRTGVGGDVHYYYNGHLGQPLKMFDREGRVVWQGRWQVFGGLHIVAEDAENNLRFPSQYYDYETRIFHNYYRDFDPVLGRYIQSDPAGLIGGLNSYVYSRAQPVNFVDPLGLKWVKAKVVRTESVLDFVSRGYTPSMVYYIGYGRVIWYVECTDECDNTFTFRHEQPIGGVPLGGDAGDDEISAILNSSIYNGHDRVQDFMRMIDNHNNPLSFCF